MDAWGKAARENPTDRHHLAHHCADVASTFLAICALPVVRSRLEQAAGQPLSDLHLQRLAVVVFLHDMGKLNSGFQWKIEPVDIKPPAAGHVQEGMDLLDRNFRRPEIPNALMIDAIFGWAEEQQIYGLFKASISHHGAPADDPRTDGARSLSAWRTFGDYDPAVAAQKLGQAIRMWFGDAFAPNSTAIPDRSFFTHLFAGLVSLSDWIGSARKYFGYTPDFDPQYISKSRKSAAAAVADFGLDTRSLRASYDGPTSFSTLTGFKNPNAAQAAVDSIGPDEQLVVLEAETGSGKTEAALLRFLRLWEAGKVDSLFFAVPTRAAAVQLHGRVQSCLNRLFGDHAPEAVLAVPGYFLAGTSTGRPLPGYQVLWDDDKKNTPERIARRWAAENSKRYLAAEIAVGTVDQAMLASLPVKHAHLRGGCLSRSLLVIDEVHASDRYMTEVQLGLLDAHHNLGGFTMLMSATLGERARCRWLRQARKMREEAENAPYPAIWLHEGRLVVPQRPAEKAIQKSVAMTLRSTREPGDCLDEACQAAEAGAKVLIIRNTVSLAIGTLKALELRLHDPSVLLTVGGSVTLHHGRFSADDRKLLDGAVEKAIGKIRPKGGRIIVGTQTLEQSLDIDADLLVTDLCPADVLLQRLGRLYRHQERKERPLNQPCCIVLIPPDGLDACLSEKLPQMINGLGAFTRDGALAGIYPDLVTLEATRRLVEALPVWTIPAMNRKLVEQATHPEAHEELLKSLPERWTLYEAEVMGKDIAEAQRAHLTRLYYGSDYSRLRFPDEERIRTRLGGEGITVQFADPPLGPFEKGVRQLTLPEHWSRGLDPMAEPEIIDLENAAISFRFSGRAFRYSRYGIQKIDVSS